MTKFERKFVLEHVFSNVSEMKEMEGKYSKKEMHFGIAWYLSFLKISDHLGVFLYCESDQKEYWTVETNYSLEITDSIGKSTTFSEDYTFNKDDSHWGHDTFLSWTEMESPYMKNDEILIKCHVTIKNISGIAKKRLRDFDESMGDISDVVLKIGDEKFHVSRMVLASYSSYFKTLFFEKFDEAKKTEIELKDIDPTEFQDFLEMIYGESIINDDNVEGLLKLAEMYDVPTVMRKCEKHLLKSSEIPEKKKLLLSSQFNLENLANSFIDKAKTVSEIRALVSNNIDELSPAVIKKMFQKVLEFDKS